MFETLVTITPGRVGKPCEYMIQEKTGNVLAHLNPYLLHLMFVALWRKPVICRSPYGSSLGKTGVLLSPDLSVWSITGRYHPVLVDPLLLVWVYDPGQTNPNIALIPGTQSEFKCPICLVPTSQLWDLSNITYPEQSRNKTLILIATANEQKSATTARSKLVTQSIRGISASSVAIAALVLRHWWCT